MTTDSATSSPAPGSSNNNTQQSSSTSTAYLQNAASNRNGVGLGNSKDGAFTRKWFNQEVTPLLLEGMRYLAREK